MLSQLCSLARLGLAARAERLPTAYHTGCTSGSPRRPVFEGATPLATSYACAPEVLGLAGETLWEFVMDEAICPEAVGLLVVVARASDTRDAGGGVPW